MLTLLLYSAVVALTTRGKIFLRESITFSELSRWKRKEINVI